MKVCIMIPAYNEAETIGEVIKGIRSALDNEDYEGEIVVIDDGSDDKTSEIATEEADKVVQHKANRGLGEAFKTGIETCLKQGADIIVNIDGDNQYDPEDIPSLVQPVVANEADLVLGWRDVDNLDFMPRKKKLGNKIATWVTRKASNFPVKDGQTGFRAFSREAALQMNLSGSYTYVQETIIQAVNNGLRIKQVPIAFRERKKSSSRLISSIFSYAQRAGLTILRSYRDQKPLRAFAFLGSLFILLSLIPGLRVLLNYVRTGQFSYVGSAILTILLVIAGIIIIVFGLLADMIKKNREAEEEILYRLKQEEVKKV